MQSRQSRCRTLLAGPLVSARIPMPARPARISRLAGALLTAGLGLSGCQADSFCRTHKASDLTVSGQAYRAMAPAERRAAEARLNEAARRCGWEP